jgi:hypothetical protein
MNFWVFAITIWCFLSAGDLVRSIAQSGPLHLPTNNAVRTIFYLGTVPATLGTVALPLYGFFIMSWWQPIAGLLIASIACGAITRPALRESGWLYVWALLFSVSGIALLFFFHLS